MRSLLAAGLLAAVLIGGLTLGALRVATDTGPDW